MLSGRFRGGPGIDSHLGIYPRRAKVYAEQAGVAFQLTNILRDLGEDAARGRVYLPREDLLRFGYTEDKLRRGERDEAFRRLMHFEIARARASYAAAWPLVPLLSPPGTSRVPGDGENLSQPARCHRSP